jgi:hypothetical protein
MLELVVLLCNDLVRRGFARVSRKAGRAKAIIVFVLKLIQGFCIDPHLLAPASAAFITAFKSFPAFRAIFLSHYSTST